MDNTDRILDMAEDMAVLEHYLSIILDNIEKGSVEMPETPSLHNQLLAEQIEQLVEWAGKPKMPV